MGVGKLLCQGAEGLGRRNVGAELLLGDDLELLAGFRLQRRGHALLVHQDVAAEPFDCLATLPFLEREPEVYGAPRQDDDRHLDVSLSLCARNHYSKVVDVRLHAGHQREESAPR